MQQLSVKALYPLALAEGEGVGTAYEYFAKRLLLRRWLHGRARPQRILIAGLPEKYGVSLDFLLLAAELQAAVTLVDDRPHALARWREARHAGQAREIFGKLDVEDHLVSPLGRLEGLAGRFDLVLASEVLQRIQEDERVLYITRITEVAPRVGLFFPNGDNAAHTHISGLAGITLGQWHSTLEKVRSSTRQDNMILVANSGYIDMPPFPPGISRSEEQRQQASSGRLEAVAMAGLGFCARLEQHFPQRWRRGKAHIVYSWLETHPR